MKFFLSGEVGSDKDGRVVSSIKRGLYTYYFQGLNGMTDRLQYGLESGQDVCLDSGAYSAFTRGEQIPLDAYIRFVLEYQDLMDIVISLDVIGDAKASWKNYRIMQSEGCDVVPVFHYGESFKYLYKMLDSTDTVGIGGLAKLPRDSRLFNFLDNVWDNIANSNGSVDYNVHGFAVTSLSLIQRYPWYSVDSTSWLFTGAMGQICIPIGDAFCTIGVSEDSPKLKKNAARHYDFLSKEEKKLVRRYLKSIGCSIEGCRFSYVERHIVNVNTFKMFEQYVATEYKPRRKGFFGVYREG